MYSPLWKITHHNLSVLCTPPFEKSSIKSHRFCVVPPLKDITVESKGLLCMSNCLINLPTRPMAIRISSKFAKICPVWIPAFREYPDRYARFLCKNLCHISRLRAYVFQRRVCITLRLSQFSRHNCHPAYGNTKPFRKRYSYRKSRLPLCIPETQPTSTNTQLHTSPATVRCKSPPRPKKTNDILYLISQD